MPPRKKRTYRAKKKSVKKAPVTELAAFSSETEVCDGVLNASGLKNEVIDNDEVLSNCETPFGLLSDTANNLDFDKNSDQIAAQFPSSSKHSNYSSKSNSSLNQISKLRSIIDKVNNMQIDPSVHVYSIEPEGKGISAVNVSKNLSHFAYSFSHSHEIHLCAREGFPDSIARNDLESTWLNFVSEKNRLSEVKKSEKEKIKFFSSPQKHVIRHKNDVTGLCFSSNDNLLLSCSLDGSAKVISTITNCVLENYDGVGLLTDIDINPGTTKFATTNVLPGDPLHVAYLYTFDRKDPILCLSGHSNTLKCIRFHPNGIYAATASSDQSIKLWSVEQGKEVRSFKDEESDHTHPEKIAFSPDGKYIASTYTGCIKIWDIASGKKIKCIKTPNSNSSNLNICYNSVGDMLAAGGSDKHIHFWNIMSDESSEMTPTYNFLKSENVGKRIFSIKFVANFFSCVTG